MRIINFTLLGLVHIIASCGSQTPNVPPSTQNNSNLYEQENNLSGQYPNTNVHQFTPDPSIEENVNNNENTTPPPQPTDYDKCFPHIIDPQSNDYEPHFPDVKIGTHCMGTNYQDITGIERVVFIGDSITEGTPPTMPWEYFREVLSIKLCEKFGWFIEISNCAEWGARADDLLMPPHEQIHNCFSQVNEKRTLVIMTMGGNDLDAIAEMGFGGAPLEETKAEADKALGFLHDAVNWFYEDPARFPNGVFVLFANAYEFTDGTGNAETCLAAAILGGMSGEWPDGGVIFPYWNDAIVQIAHETQTDMIFLFEHFCGHGYSRDDPNSPCYLGEDADLWFDDTCIHPNPRGHRQIADMFFQIVNE